MELAEDVQEKIMELGNEIFTVLSLSRILVECDGVDDELNDSDRQVLIRLLSDKASVMRNKFNEIELALI